jgi:hypothetical protein
MTENEIRDCQRITLIVVVLVNVAVLTTIVVLGVSGRLL